MNPRTPLMNKYAAQIQMLDSFGCSGEVAFAAYRQSSLLIIGSGPFLISLASSLFESGLSKFHVGITDSEPTDRHRLSELVNQMRQSDPNAQIKEIILKGEKAWQEAIGPFDAIMYVSQQGDMEELRTLHAVCRDQKKVLLPAICRSQMGVAGPLVHPESDGCWESAWRRIHQSALGHNQLPTAHNSSYARAMLANIMVYEWMKWVTGASKLESSHRLFLLDPDTLEGNWHSFLPHPLITGLAAAHWAADWEHQLEQPYPNHHPQELLLHFNTLTSATTGIFQHWEEGNLTQLPLAQCYIQAADPLSEGPAERLACQLCAHLTHEGARREAGLIGIEAYVSRMTSLLVQSSLGSIDKEPLIDEQPIIDNRLAFIGVGVGETYVESVSRGLHKCLSMELNKHIQLHSNQNLTTTVQKVLLSTVEDVQCRYYVQALTTMQGTPVIGLGEPLLGFPVCWVGVNGHWHGGVDVNITLALRRALLEAVMKLQNQPADQETQPPSQWKSLRTNQRMSQPNGLTTQGLESSSLLLDGQQPTVLEEQLSLSLAIPPSEAAEESQILRSALHTLQQNGKRLLVLDINLEHALTNELMSVVGVILREESSL